MRKYLVYAIGEILLVMIGILLALQVNNWNEQRKERNTEVAYLISLKTEYQLNHESIMRTIRVNDRNLKSARAVLDLTGPNPVIIADTTFSKLLNRTFSYPGP